MAPAAAEAEAGLEAGRLCPPWGHSQNRVPTPYCPFLRSACRRGRGESQERERQRTYKGHYHRKKGGQ